MVEKYYFNPGPFQSFKEGNTEGTAKPETSGEVVDLAAVREEKSHAYFTELAKDMKKEMVDSLPNTIAKEEYRMEYMRRELLVVKEFVKGMWVMTVIGFIKTEEKDLVDSNPRTKIFEIETVFKNDILVAKLQKNFPRMPIKFKNE